MNFVHTSVPQRVVFAAGVVAEIGREAQALGMERAVVVSTPGQAALAARVGGHLGTRGAGSLPMAVMHTPVEVTKDALRAAAELGADGLVAVGGGSAIGLSKALALRTGLPQIAVPTTYSGSEMTSLIGQTQAGVKQTERSETVRPKVVLYDPRLSEALPTRIACLSAMNALAHAVEALYAPDSNPVTTMMAEEGIGALRRALPVIAAGREATDARTQALYGAWLCGACLGALTMGLHHKLCHLLGGAYDLPHAETHSVLLPYVLAHNAPHAGRAVGRLRRALDTADPVDALFRLQDACGLPASLAELGMPRAGLAETAREAARAQPANPAPVVEAGISGLLARAWEGRRPQPAPAGGVPALPVAS